MSSTKFFLLSLMIYPIFGHYYHFELNFVNGSSGHGDTGRIVNASGGAAGDADASCDDVNGVDERGAIVDMNYYIMFIVMMDLMVWMVLMEFWLQLVLMLLLVLSVLF